MLEAASPFITPRLVLVICATALVTTLINTLFIRRFVAFPPHRLHIRYDSLSAHTASNSRLDANTRARLARRFLHTWLHHLRRFSPRIRTQRIGCREFPAGAQTCVYEGVVCVDTSASRPFGKPRVYFVDDGRKNGTEVPSDHWCGYRHQSSDPRYWGPRHWPIWKHTIAPQWSCLNAFYRSAKSLQLRSSDRVKWVESMWLVDLDYVDNNHNNHLFMDIVWLLDAVLWQKSVDLRRRPGMGEGAGSDKSYNNTAGHLFEGGPRRLYLPQGRHDFEVQTGRDLNRLLYALVLQLNLSRLYPSISEHTLRGDVNVPRETEPLLSAYPELSRRLLFHRELRNDSAVDLVCAARFTAGAKLATAGHERVCRSIRRRAWTLYGIPQLPMKRVGQAYYPQPPKRIVILQRHISRKIRNVIELEKSLRHAFPRKRGFSVELVLTDKIDTAEQWVRVFSRAGVLVSSHGSQNMGQMFMPRHSALVEIMPVGYSDYSFDILSANCKIWYYQMQSLRNPDYAEEYYMKHCISNIPHLLTPCNEVKNIDIQVDIARAIKIISFAFERMGHVTKPWMDFVRKG